MSFASRRAQLLCLCVFAAAQLGCGPDDGKTEIEGTATWNGKPIEEGYLELNPIGGGGQIDGAEIKDGKFTVRTNEGEKLVKVTAKRKIGETPATDRMPAEAIYHQYIPEKFNQASELKKTVSGGELLELALEGEELKPGAESASEAARRKAQGGGGP